MSLLTPIQEFYKDATVFLTGATGFVGKAVLEKLLRSCPDLKKIYVLIRPKKGVTTEERIENLFNNVYFDKLKSCNPRFKNYISLMNGDLLQDNLGLSEKDRDILTNEVNIIIHLAATVKFDEKLKIAVKLNIVAVRHLLELSKINRHLKSFVYVSTAYSHCYKSDIKEEFYEPTREPIELIEYVEKTNEEYLDEASIIGEYPNTYTFTKGLAEDIVRREGKGLPLCIVRPSIVLGSWAEPLRGWVDNLYGPLGLMVAMGFGLLRVQYIDVSKRVDLIPVDMTANAIIGAAMTNSKQSKDDSITIYQIAPGNSNPVTWSEFFMWNINLYSSYMSPKALWTPFLITTKCVYASQIYQFFLQTIPGHILDFLLKITGKKPIFVKILKKIKLSQKLTEYFTFREWNIHNDNTRELFFALDKRDQDIFNFDVKQIEWDLYFLYNIRSARANLMQDPLSTVPEGLRKTRRFKIVNTVLLALFIYLIYYLYCAIF